MVVSKGSHRKTTGEAGMVAHPRDPPRLREAEAGRSGVRGQPGI